VIIFQPGHTLSMAGRRKNTQSRAIDAFCVGPARDERKKAEQRGDTVGVVIWRKVEDYCIERREAAKGGKMRRKKSG
jgi:hypothetical protein